MCEAQRRIGKGLYDFYDHAFSYKEAGSQGAWNGVGRDRRSCLSGAGFAVGWSVPWGGAAGAVMYLSIPYTDDSETWCARCGCLFCWPLAPVKAPLSTLRVVS
jgi:hypothetical protein